MPFNRAYNGGFEIADGTGAFPDGWVKGAGDANTVWTWAAENPYDGSRALRIANPTFTANLTSVIQDASAAVAVVPEERWEASAWMMTDAAGKALRVLVDFYSGTGAFVHSAHLKFASTTSLRRYAGVVTVPAGAATARLNVGMHDTGTVWFDAVGFVRLNPLDAADVGRQRENTFERTVTGLGTGDAFAFLAPVESGELATLTFVVRNTGAQSLTVQIQVSSDAANWLDDSPEAEVAAGAGRTLAPRTFARYTRLAHRSTTAGLPTTLDVTLQGQFL